MLRPDGSKLILTHRVTTHNCKECFLHGLGKRKVTFDLCSSIHTNSGVGTFVIDRNGSFSERLNPGILIQDFSISCGCLFVVVTFIGLLSHRTM